MNEKFHQKPDLLVLTGSRLYGTDVAGSDTDHRGFVTPPFEYIIGRKHWEFFESTETDMVIYSVTKFMHLLEKFSPNTLELLFATDSHVKVATDIGKFLLANRSAFVSKQIVKPLEGFAHSEWKKATEYFEQTRKLGASRKSDIEAYGYSIKNAYHAVRILDQCLELLKCGELIFPRHNAEYLRKIRLGQIDIDDVTAYYGELKSQIAPALSESELPEIVDKDRIDAIFYSLIGDEFEKFRNRSYDVPERVKAIGLPIPQK